MSEAAKQITFSGRVQGVGFRFTAYNIANRCQLKGYVRNMPDGSVEMLAQGSLEDIDDCVRNIKESFAAYIKETTLDPIPPDPQHTTFKITF